MTDQPAVKARRRITTQDIALAALRRVRLWQANRGEIAARCPLCDAPGFTIIDRSARPYSEWYVMSCAACGFDDTLQVPSAARNP